MLSFEIAYTAHDWPTQRSVFRRRIKFSCIFGAENSAAECLAFNDRSLQQISPEVIYQWLSITTDRIYFCQTTSIVHAKLDYCNSLFLNIDVTQINRLQAIQNALAHAVTKTPKHHHITPVLKKLHWLKIPERIEYKVILLTYNTLQSSQPSYLRQLFTIQPPRSPRSPSTLTLLRPSVPSSLKFSNRSIAVAVPPLWNK